MSNNDYLKYLPERINVLIILDSPPFKKLYHFYDYLANPLKKHIFNLVNVNSLSEFKGAGFFLTTAIKCRLLINSDIKKRVVRHMIRNCIDLLAYELDIYNDLNVKKVIVLGRYALYAMKLLVSKMKLYHKLPNDVHSSDRLGWIIYKERKIETLILPSISKWNKFEGYQKLSNLVRNFIRM